MHVNLSGKVAIVTGGAGAIGSAICGELAKNGANVVIADRNEAAMAELAAKLSAEGCEVMSVCADVSCRESAERMIAATVEKFGRVDCLVNNAGINGGPDQRKPIHEYDDALWDAILAVDLTGVYRCSKPAVAQMIRQGGGCIVNISSVTGITPLRMQCAFTAAKAGVVNLSKAMALELAEHNIRVNVIAPGSILFEGTRKLFYADAAKAEALLSHIPLHRAGAPEDIAAMVSMLASDDTAYMTGSVVTIDGGWTSGYSRDF